MPAYSPTFGLDPTKVLSGQTGGVVTAPLGTAAPSTDLMGEWVTGWVTLGVIDESGLTESRATDRVDKGSWQYSGVVRSLLTRTTETFTFTIIETNSKVVSLYYQIAEAAMVVGGAGPNVGVVTMNTGARPGSQRRAFGIDVVDGANARRFVIPNGEVTGQGDITYVTNDLIMYNLTLTAYPTTAGFSVQRHFREGWAPPI